MKITPHFLSPILACGFLLSPALAEDPAAVTLTPEMQALLAELLKSGVPSEAELTSEAEAEPAAAKPLLGSGSSLRTGRLTTSSLSGGRLAPASKSDGRGSGIARLSESAWRLFFPAH